MKNITNYETKEIECDKCGRVSSVAKKIPLHFACCKECGSLKIRLYKGLLTQRARDAYKAGKIWADDPPREGEDLPIVARP